METIGKKINSLRKEKNLSQEQLAFELGVARQTVSKWESDAVVPETENLDRICGFFGVDITYLLGKAETASTEDESLAHNTVTENVEKFDTLKTVLKVVGVVFLVLCLIACSIAAYITIEPTGQYEKVAINVNYIGIVFLVAGIFLATILFTLLVIFVKKRLKNRKNIQMSTTSDKIPPKGGRQKT